MVSGMEPERGYRCGRVEVSSVFADVTELHGADATGEIVCVCGVLWLIIPGYSNVLNVSKAWLC